MGAAIRSAEEVRLHDILGRTFGVIRLSDHGQKEYFSPIFPAGMRLPKLGIGPPPPHCGVCPAAQYWSSAVFGMFGGG